MKKLLLVIALITASFSVSAQNEKGESGMVIHAGVETDPGRFLVGAQWRYALFTDFRFALDGKFLFPKDRIVGLNINTNLHYVIELDHKMNVYPLMGIAMQNDRYMGKTIAGEKIPAKGFTNWGFNLGGGYEYHLSERMFLNTEVKYIFGKADCLDFSFGIGFKI